MSELQNYPHGTVLATKDGRNIGNGVVLSVSEVKPDVRYCFTDAGNLFTYTVEELQRQFHVPEHRMDGDYLKQFIGQREGYLATLVHIDEREELLRAIYQPITEGEKQ